MKKYTIGGSALFILFILILYSHSVIGVRAKHIEVNTRKSQQIAEDWLVAQSINDHLAVLLFYDEDLSDYTYSIYLNRKGFSFGYFFRSGGSVFNLPEDIMGFSYEEGMALMSLNEAHISRIEITTEESHIPLKTYELDPNKPFALALPYNATNERIVLYDQRSHEVPITSISINN